MSLHPKTLMPESPDNSNSEILPSQRHDECKLLIFPQAEYAA